jgi:hypothetical protein
MIDNEGHWIDDPLEVVNTKPDFSGMGLEPIKTKGTMTDKQKEAIRILNRIKEPVIIMGDEMHPAAIDDDEYFTLLEFVVNCE